MNIEQQVCTLEQAKRLKELGVKQESNFYYNNGAVWYLYDVTDWGMQTQFYEECLNDERLPERDDIISAFTVVELLELLPPRTSITKGNTHYHCRYWWGKYLDGVLREGVKENSWHGTKSIHAAESLAAMLIYLIENNLHQPHKN